METHNYTDEMQARRERVVRNLSVAKDKPGDTPDPEIIGPEVAGSRWREWASSVALALAVLPLPVLYLVWYFLYKSSPSLPCLIIGVGVFGLIYLVIEPDSQSNSTGGRVGSGDGGGWGGDWGGDGGDGGDGD